MDLDRAIRLGFALIAIAVTAAMLPGCASCPVLPCASCPGPRIDPTGERLIVWGNQAPSAPAATFASPAATANVYPPPGAYPPPLGGAAPGTASIAPPAAVAAPPPGNVLAPPVYSNTPSGPPVSAPVITGPHGAAPQAGVGTPAIGTSVATPVTLAVAAGPAGVATPLGGAAPAGRDYMRVTPDRILAPVGSEVVLKAGICSASGYLLANQRVEWLLPAGGTGQFVDLAERDQFSVLRWLRDTPRKVDNSYAITSTSWMPVCLNRGTPDPGDDVQILKGDAWVTVTSSVEGTSQVTAYSPSIADWNLRRATATIYWVDAQWILPASTVAAAGRPHVHTTTVLRRTDGAPLAGWLVRYEVPTGASLGYQGGNVIEVPTDANGRASVEVAPSDVGGGTATVSVTIVRPPQTGTNAAPRLEVGRGAATITWSSGVTSAPPTSPPFTTMPPASPPATSPYEPAPTSPPPATSPQPAPYTPPANEPPPGRSRLDVRIDRPVPEQVAVGDFVSFNVTVTNIGDGTARQILIKDEFDRGLRHPEDRGGQYAIEYPNMQDLAPGQSASVPLTFQVTAGGEQCHRVTVSAEGADPVTASGCVTARQAALTIEATGPRSHIVGQTAAFRAVVRNVGDVAATNVAVVAQCDPALVPLEAETGHERLPDGGIQLRFDRLEPGEQRTFNLTATCATQAVNACTRFVLTADGGVTSADEACLEILPLAPPAGAGASGAPSLRLTITESANPMRTGDKRVVYVNVENSGSQPATQVALSVLFPPELTPDVTQIQPAEVANVLGQEIRFGAIAELLPQGEKRYLIPVTARQAGEVQIRALIKADGMTEGSRVESNVIRILSQ